MALVSTSFILVFPAKIATTLIGIVGGLLPEGGSLDFVVQRYTPRLRQALQDAGIKACLETRLSILFKLAGIGVKIVRTTCFFVPLFCSHDNHSY
jgi:hypothetical protein